jgi:putative SOS response-associated peptidase YedK
VRKGSSIPVRMSGRTMDVAIHNRMPDILQDDQIEHWLDPTASDPSVKAAV